MKLNVSFAEINETLVAPFAESKQSFSPEFEGFQKITEYLNTDPYTGDYEITPKVDAQTLPTAQKFLHQDVTVKGIPIFDVSNMSGGRTVYIAKEV